MGIRQLLKGVLTSDPGVPLDQEATAFDLAAQAAVDAELAPALARTLPARAFEIAADFLAEGNPTAAAYSYGRIAENFPDVRQDAEALLGIVNYCQGCYAEAIEHYIRARVHGANTAWVDEIIWEACETQFLLAEDPV